MKQILTGDQQEPPSSEKPSTPEDAGQVRASGSDNAAGDVSPPSAPDASIHKLFARHFKTIVVAILFLAVLGALSLYLYTHLEPNTGVLGIFSTVLLALGQYFVGSVQNLRK